jgi:hypothetical protein
MDGKSEKHCEESFPNSYREQDFPEASRMFKIEK